MKMKNDLFRKYDALDLCKKPIKTLVKCFKEGNYLKVIILSPQVFGLLVDDIVKPKEEFYNDWIEHKVGKPSKIDYEIEEHYHRLLKEESIKARVVEFLVHSYFSGYSPISSKEIKKCFTKLDNIFAQRNFLAHEFFSKDIKDKVLLRTAKDCFYIIDTMLICDQKVPY